MVGFAYYYSGFTCCRRISVSTKLSFFPEVMLHVGTFFVFMSFDYLVLYHRLSKHDSSGCLRSVNEVICHGIPDARY